MEWDTMGRVLTEATVESLEDLWEVKRGLRSPEGVRRLIIPDALVDTGATGLSLPTRLIQQLGLTKRSEKRVRTSAGPGVAAIYDAVRLIIQGRECTVDVTEVPDNVPVLIGQIPLEFLDFVIDPRGGRLIGNPAHGGEHVLELY
ncbi:MAG: aspartyl protease family protein [Planctomycetes bacterium]|nr:aspartyl protease family protein [Planctomycetota bacterium]